MIKAWASRGGVRTALRALLASPDFVFRMEETPDGVVPGDIIGSAIWTSPRDSLFSFGVLRPIKNWLA